MVDAKTTHTKIIYLLLIGYLISFPFGQFTSFSIFSYDLFLTDLFVLLIALIHSLKYKFSAVKHFTVFITIMLFSYLFSLVYYDFTSMLGFLYLIRLLAYLILFDAVLNLLKSKTVTTENIQILLVFAGSIAAFFGLLQYLFSPDLRFLYYIGWDMHYGRLAGTFLDPTFIGLILVLNILLIVNKYLSKRENYLVFLFIINFSALLLTFSRASYLALIAGIFLLFRKQLSLKKIILVVAVFFAILYFLPRYSSEGTTLLRTSTIFAKLDDYSDALIVIKENPLFGIGYNNLCDYKVRFMYDNYDSHSCSGLDSSMLFLLSTTGIAGIVAFIYSFQKLTIKLRDKQKLLVYSSMTAVFVHSLFSNSMFYPWIMGWMFILMAVSVKLGGKTDS